MKYLAIPVTLVALAIGLPASIKTESSWFTLPRAHLEIGVERYARTKVLLTWKADPANAILGFEVQRHAGQGNFETIGLVPAGERSHYRYVDSAPTPRESVYRLKQIMQDGRTLLSSAVRYTLPAGVATAQIVPTYKGRAIEFAFQLADQVDVSMKVFTTSGEQILSRLAQAYPKGLNKVTWDGVNEAGQHVPAGNYIAEFRIGEQKEKIAFRVQ